MDILLQCLIDLGHSFEENDCWSDLILVIIPY